MMLILICDSSWFTLFACICISMNAYSAAFGRMKRSRLHVATLYNSNVALLKQIWSFSPTHSCLSIPNLNLITCICRPGLDITLTENE